MKVTKMLNEMKHKNERYNKIEDDDRNIIMRDDKNNHS